MLDANRSPHPMIKDKGDSKGINDYEGLSSIPIGPNQRMPVAIY
jgi:hypothetical protein